MMFDDLLDNLQKRKAITERLAALNETKSWEQIALALYGILDDIDTEDDRCRENNEAFRRFVMQHQARKNQYLMSPDGRNVVRVEEGMADYAKRELQIAGLFDEDSDYEGMIGEAVMQLVELFASQGHSGCSADITRSIFDRLTSFKPLTELTNDPTEWNEIAEETVDGTAFKMYQSTRSPVCFSRDGGKTYYNIDEIEGCRVPGKEPMHTSVERRVESVTEKMTVTTIPIKNHAPNGRDIPSSTYNVIEVVEFRGHKFYVTDVTLDDGKKREPLVIVDTIVQSVNGSLEAK